MAKCPAGVRHYFFFSDAIAGEAADEFSGGDVLAGQHDGVTGDAGRRADDGGRQRDLAEVMGGVAVGVDAGEEPMRAPLPMVMPPRSFKRACWRMVAPSSIVRL